MSFKNMLTKVGLVEDDSPVTKKTSAPVPQPVKVTSSTATVIERPSYSTPTAGVDPEITEMLQKSLEESKLSNFDYLKYISVVEKMKGKVSSEEARFQTAFSAAEELGVTKANLLKSTDHYLDVLKEDENDFNSNCNDYDKKEVKSRENKLAQIDASITSLTKQLEQAQADRESLAQELEDQKSTLESKKTSFQATLESFRSTIQENVQKINQYL